MSSSTIRHPPFLCSVSKIFEEVRSVQLMGTFRPDLGMGLISCRAAVGVRCPCDTGLELRALGSEDAAADRAVLL